MIILFHTSVLEGPLEPHRIKFEDVVWLNNKNPEDFSEQVKHAEKLRKRNQKRARENIEKSGTAATGRVKN